MLAEKNRLRPWLGDIPQCPENELFQRHNPATFLGQSRRQPKMFRAGLYARVSTNDQQTPAMQNRAMQEYAERRGWTITLQVRQVNSGAARREAREKLLEAARRREIDAPQRHLVPQLPLPDSRPSERADLPGVRRSLAVTRYLMEMCRRQFADQSTRHRFQRLEKRLLTVAFELDRLDPPGK